MKTVQQKTSSRTPKSNTETAPSTAHVPHVMTATDRNTALENVYQAFRDLEQAKCLLVDAIADSPGAERRAEMIEALQHVQYSEAWVGAIGTALVGLEKNASRTDIAIAVALEIDLEDTVLGVGFLSDAEHDAVMAGARAKWEKAEREAAAAKIGGAS